jgi:hypothetical protein
MGPLLFLHILAGSFGLAAGYLALFARKGAATHRRAGIVFVVSMLVMSILGAFYASTQGIAAAINVPAGMLTAQLVASGFLTVRPGGRYDRWFHAGGLLLALAVAVPSLTFGLQAVARGGSRDGMPAFPFFMFGGVAAIAAVGDLRRLLGGRLHGAARLARHLWRMCFALFVAALSFFIGQADTIPEPIRIRPLLAVPALAVLAMMFWWLWRVRRGRGRAGRLAAEGGGPGDDSATTTDRTTATRDLAAAVAAAGVGSNRAFTTAGVVSEVAR